MSASEFAKEQDRIAAEAIGWIPLGDGTYLHVADGTDSFADDEEVVITVTGVPDASMAGMNVLLLS